MPSPRISVIIPAYRAAAYLGEALDSVLAQKIPAAEIIVVNDGSPDTDALRQVVEGYRGRIIYLEKENGGVSSARNAGIQAATGEWLAFLDADDVWMPNFLEVQLEFLGANPGADMIFSNCIYFGDTILAGCSSMDVAPIHGEITFLRALEGECTIPYCGLVRRDLVVRAGLFDTSLKGSEDYNLWLRILKLGAVIKYHREPLYRYRKHGASLTSDTIWMAEWILQSLQHSEETIPLTAEEHAAAGKHRRKIEFEIETMRGRAALQTKNWAGAIEHYGRANSLRPSRKLQWVLVLLRVCPRLLYNVFLGRQYVAVRLSKRQLSGR